MPRSKGDKKRTQNLINQCSEELRSRGYWDVASELSGRIQNLSIQQLEVVLAKIQKIPNEYPKLPLETIDRSDYVQALKEGAIKKLIENPTLVGATELDKAQASGEIEHLLPHQLELFVEAGLRWDRLGQFRDVTDKARFASLVWAHKVTKDHPQEVCFFTFLDGSDESDELKKLGLLLGLRLKHMQGKNYGEHTLLLIHMFCPRDPGKKLDTSDVARVDALYERIQHIGPDGVVDFAVNEILSELIKKDGGNIMQDRTFEQRCKEIGFSMERAEATAGFCGEYLACMGHLIRNREFDVDRAYRVVADLMPHQAQAVREYDLTREQAEKLDSQDAKHMDALVSKNILPKEAYRLVTELGPHRAHRVGAMITYNLTAEQAERLDSSEIKVMHKVIPPKSLDEVLAMLRVWQPHQIELIVLYDVPEKDVYKLSASHLQALNQGWPKHLVMRDVDTDWRAVVAITRILNCSQNELCDALLYDIVLNMQQVRSYYVSSGDQRIYELTAGWLQALKQGWSYDLIKNNPTVDWGLVVQHAACHHKKLQFNVTTLEVIVEELEVIKDFSPPKDQKFFNKELLACGRNLINLELRQVLPEFYRQAHGLDDKTLKKILQRLTRIPKIREGDFVMVEPDPSGHTYEIPEKTGNFSCDEAAANGGIPSDDTYETPEAAAGGVRDIMPPSDTYETLGAAADGANGGIPSDDTYETPEAAADGVRVIMLPSDTYETLRAAADGANGGIPSDDTYETLQALPLTEAQKKAKALGLRDEDVRGLAAIRDRRIPGLVDVSLLVNPQMLIDQQVFFRLNALSQEQRVLLYYGLELSQVEGVNITPDIFRLWSVFTNLAHGMHDITTVPANLRQSFIEVNRDAFAKLSSNNLNPNQVIVSMMILSASVVPDKYYGKLDRCSATILDKMRETSCSIM